MTDVVNGSAVYVRAGTADPVWAMGSLFEMVLPGAASGGELAVMRVRQPVGIATPLHRHTAESEVFYLLGGQLDYEAGGELYHLSAGDLIWLPRSVPHRFRIRGDEPADILALTVPGGLDDLYRGVGRPADERDLPAAYPPDEELARWRDLGPQFGLEVLGPPLPE